MKKSIGLTADVSTFNTTLPQTRHLNYFMNTNPKGFAKGGDVKAGIPNYPNPNLTSGFLPMALGFDNGGEANSGLLQQIDKLMLILGGDMKKVIEYLKKWLGYTDEQINSALNQKDAQVPSDRQPGIDIANQIKPVTPKDTVTTTPSDRQPGLDVPLQPLVPSDRQPQFNIPPSLVPLPKISIEQRQRDFEDKQRAPDTVPGITSIIPSDRQPGIGIANEIQPTESKEELPIYMKPFDLNKDGVVDGKDLEIAKNNPLYRYAIKPILDWLGLSETDPEDLPDIEIEPDLEDDKKEDDKGGITEIKPSDRQPGLEPDKDGIAGVPPKGAVDVTGQPTISKEEQNTLKKGADIAAGGVGDIKDKKDVPAWALPMMSAGFAMMASKSPYFMQALGEAGQAGVETYTAQKTAEEDKLDKESARELAEAQAAYYRGEGRQTSTKTVVQDGMLYKSDGTPFYITTPKGEKIHAKASLTFEDAMALAPKYYGAQWDMMDETQRTKATFALMEMYKNQAAGLNVEDNVGAEITDEGGGLTDWFKNWLGLKDGGIVSLRR